MKNKTRILMMEDNKGDVDLLMALLAQEAYFKADIDVCTSLVEGVYKLCTLAYDVVLLDINLTDSRGEETFDRVHALSLQVPIIVFTGLNDHELGLKLVKKGAQDYLVKGQLEGAAIVRVIQYAIERKQLMSSLLKLSKALEQSPVSVIITDVDGKIEYVNERFSRMVDSPEALIGKNPLFEKDGYFAQAPNQEIWNLIAAGHTWEGEVRHKSSGNEHWEYVSVTPVVGSNDKVSNFLVIKEDITVRKRYEEQIFHQSNFDSLTGLPNRHLATDRLNQYLVGPGLEGQLALIFVGLRHFNAVNDAHGHAFGDKALVEAAKRLKNALQAEDTLARFGGDEFLIIFKGTDGSLAAINRCISTVLEAFERPFLIDGKELNVRACLGVSLYPSDGKDAQTLLNSAHVAMNHCKREHALSLRYFQSDMNESALKRITLDAHLRRALSSNEFSLCYQPQVDVATNTLIGAEALLRWNNKEFGNVSPEIFIPIAEDTDLILKIGAWVLREACAQFKRWQQQSGKDLKLAVNVSTRQLLEGQHFVKLVLETISETKISPHTLELEITEYALIEQQQTVAETIAQLRKSGVEFAIDDFGVGYSSLSYIKDFQIKTLKIDRSFIRRVPHKETDTSLAGAIVALGHGLGLQVIAEGIENQAQLDFIRERGCDVYQGYFFAKPLAAGEFEERFIK
jgi:diguanylate cyclase (GGDEF)-like protein/PAS domain S-box-containing protein